VYISKVIEEGGWEVVFRYDVSDSDHDVSDPGVTLVLSQALDDESWRAELVGRDGKRHEVPVRMNEPPSAP
jgi:hypothetical protein